LSLSPPGETLAPVLSPAAVITSVLPVYLLIVAGALLRKTGVLRPHHDEGIMRVVFTVMLPCFILDKILGSTVLRSGGVVIWAVALGFAMVVVGIAIGWMVGRLLGLERGTGMRTFALTSGCQNFGFTAIPVVEILWGGGALALLFVHNIGVELVIWTIGVMIMSGDRGISWRKLLNGPLIASVLGILLVASRLDGFVTGPPRFALSMLGIGAFPLAILITGCSMMDLAGAEKPSWRIVAGSALVRLALAPFAIICAAKFLPIATELKQVLVVQAAMPAALTPILLARIYGGRPAVAVQVVIGTTVLSLLTLPWIVTWGTRWLDLKPMLP
jgi:malate permease and related proteins